MSRSLALDDAVLKQIPLFSLLSGEKRDALCRAGRRCRHARASMIVTSADGATGLYVLLAGRAKAVVEDGQGRAMTAWVIETHEFFGSTDLLDEGGRWTGIEALEPCETLYIPRPAFLECIEGNYRAAMVILSAVEARLRKAHQKIASLGLLDVYGRVARLLIDSAQEVNGQWIVETGAEEIARTVAASREMVSRVVKAMRKQGLVRKDKRRTVILDRQSMSAACPL